MKVNITSEYVPLKEFLELLDTATNLKDVHLLCHQAGCPVYVLRNTEDKCAILWHPSIEAEKDIMHLVVKEGILEVMFDGKALDFDTLEYLNTNPLVRHMLGDTPFDPKYLIWAKGTPSLFETIQVCGS